MVGNDGLALHGAQGERGAVDGEGDVAARMLHQRLVAQNAADGFVDFAPTVRCLEPRSLTNSVDTLSETSKSAVNHQNYNICYSKPTELQYLLLKPSELQYLLL